MNNFANRLKQKMNEEKITQKHLADVIGTSQWTISQYVNGKGEPNEERLKKISEFLECSVDWLKGNDEPEENDVDIKRNASGYVDPTAYKAIQNSMKKSEPDFFKGDIFWIDDAYYKDQYGKEESQRRPGVIVSNDRLNAVMKQVEVVYLTSKNGHRNQYNIPVLCKVPSTAMCSQVSTVDKSRLSDFIRRCTDEEMSAIEKGLMASFGLDLPLITDVPAVERAKDREIDDLKKKLECVEMELDETKEKFMHEKNVCHALQVEMDKMRSEEQELEAIIELLKADNERLKNAKPVEDNAVEVSVMKAQLEIYKQQNEMMFEKLLGR